MGRFLRRDAKNERGSVEHHRNSVTGFTIETTQREIAGSKVKIARLLVDPDNPLASSGSNDAEFLLVTDWQDPFFDTARLLLIPPYPKACCAMCRYFEQAYHLTKELRPPLLILFPQNLILGYAVHEFASLLHELPELRVLLYSGSACTVEFLQEAGLGPLLDSDHGEPRIEVRGVSFPREDFFATIARRFGLVQRADGSSVIN